MEVPVDRVGKAFARIYRQVGRQAKVRGFRPGKIPQHVLRGLYGTEIQSQALSELVEEALAGAMQDQGLEPVAEPRLETGELNEAQPFAFTAVIEVKPEIGLKNYRAIPLERVRADVSDEDVERALKALQDRNAQLEAVEGRDRVEDGDYVLIEFSGSVDGKPFPGSTAENYAVDIGAGQALPEFEQGLVGMTRGVPGNITVNSPGDANREHAAGTSADFEVTVKDIRHKILPPLDDEFARDYGECDSLEELRERLRVELQNEIETFQNGPLKDQIVERLAEEHTFDVSPSMVDRELSYLMRRAKSQRESSGSEAPEPTTDEMREELTPQARASGQDDVADRKDRRRRGNHGIRRRGRRPHRSHGAGQRRAGGLGARAVWPGLGPRDDALPTRVRKDVGFPFGGGRHHGSGSSGNRLLTQYKRG